MSEEMENPSFSCVVCDSVERASRDQGDQPHPRDNPNPKVEGQGGRVVWSKGQRFIGTASKGSQKCCLLP